MAKRVKIPGRLESAETGNIVAGADAVMDDAKGKTQVVINSEVDVAIISLAHGKQDNLTFDSAPTEGSSNPVTSAGVYTADKVLSDAIEAILLLIPSAASALNKLVDMQTMNSSIATATASFKGTYNLVSDLHLGVDATHEQIGAALDALSLGADNNDYAFVQVPNSATAPTEIRVTERYKFNGTNWLFEYDLNNSGFTQGQWNAINSGVTSLLVGKLSDLPTNAELTNLLAGKQDNLTFDNVPTAGSPNPVKSGGVYARNNEIVALINALDAAKQDVLTFDNAPVEGSPNPVTSAGVYTAISAVQAAIVALDAEKQNVLTFDSTPTLGSANPVTSSGIKTELNRIDGNITTLNDLYEALTQSAMVVVQPSDTWPVASPATKIIYRVVDRVNTPPQNYSDYMWNGTVMVLMATYDNAIDDVPTPLSGNLAKSEGILDSLDNKQMPSAHINVIKGFQTDLTNGKYKANNAFDISEPVYLFGDTKNIAVGGGFSPLRYVYFYKDGTVNQLVTTAVPENAFAVRLLFTSGTYSDYSGLYIEQDGGYQKASDCKFGYHIPIPQIKTGKFYNVASNQVTVVDNASSKYLDPIDVSKFKGKYIEINISDYIETSSGRAMAVVASNYLTIYGSYLREATPTSVNGNVATFRLYVGNEILLVSFSLAFNIKSIIVKDAENVGDAINDIYDKISEGTPEKNNKVYSKEVSPKWYDGYIDSSGNLIEGASSLQRITDFISVVPGMRIQVRYSAVAGRLPVTMYSSAQMSSIILSKCTEGDNSTHLDILTIPNGVNYIRISHDSRGGEDSLFNPYILGDMDKIEASIPLAASINKQWLRLHKTAPKKPVIAFEMDMNNYSATNAIAYIDKLESYGVQGSTFFTFPTLNWTTTYDFQKVLREIHVRNHEIALHSLPNDGTGETTGTPQATESQFRAFMKTYFDWFSKFGFYPTGWVTSQGKLYDGLLPLVKEYMCYAHTLLNGNWQTEQATDYIIPRSGDRYTFKRYGYEMGPSGTSEQETELINKIKAGIDAAVANNGMLILYCHSYNDNRPDYTLRESVLTAVLEYIKPLIDSYRIVTGNVQDLVEYYFD